MNFNVTFGSSAQGFNLAFGSSEQSYTMGFGAVTQVLPAPYPGPYEATPSMEEQTFNMRGMAASEDFVVHKIPSNYGLITYNGFEIMVS